jgi:hypothetical protein
LGAQRKPPSSPGQHWSLAPQQVSEPLPGSVLQAVSPAGHIATQVSFTQIGVWEGQASQPGELELCVADEDVVAADTEAPPSPPAPVETSLSQPGPAPQNAARPRTQETRPSVGARMGQGVYHGVEPA